MPFFSGGGNIMAALEASEGAGLIITGSLLEAAGSVVTTGSCSAASSSSSPWNSERSGKSLPSSGILGPLCHNNNRSNNTYKNSQNSNQTNRSMTRKGTGTILMNKTSLYRPCHHQIDPPNIDQRSHIYHKFHASFHLTIFCELDWFFWTFLQLLHYPDFCLDDIWGPVFCISFLCLDGLTLWEYQEARKDFVRNGIADVHRQSLLRRQLLYSYVDSRHQDHLEFRPTFWIKSPLLWLIHVMNSCQRILVPLGLWCSSCFDKVFV